MLLRRLRKAAEAAWFAAREELVDPCNPLHLSQMQLRLQLSHLTSVAPVGTGVRARGRCQQALGSTPILGAAIRNSRIRAQHRMAGIGPLFPFRRAQAALGVTDRDQAVAIETNSAMSELRRVER